MTNSEPRLRREPGELALHPVVLLALALWLLNDHVLKGALGGPVPGKLSDIASLVAFPVLPFCATELLFARRGRRAPGRGHLAFWAAAAAFVMVVINVFPAAADVYRWGLGAAQMPFRALLGGALELRPVSLTMDPTDCWTVPAALVPLWLHRRQTGQTGQTGQTEQTGPARQTGRTSASFAHSGAGL